MRSSRNLLLFAFTVIITGCASMAADTKQEQKIVDTNVQLAIGYLKKGHIDVALEKIQRALELDWDYADAHSTAAIIYDRLQNFDKAENHYQTAIELKPKDGGVYNNYGVFLCSQKKWTQAVGYFLKAIEMPRYATPEQAYENAGSCARQIPDIVNAELYLRRALDKNAKLPVALYEMAQISYSQQKPMSVRAYLQRYEEVATHTPQSLWLGIQIERKLGNNGAAERYAKLLQTKYPRSKEFKRLLDSSGAGS